MSFNQDLQKILEIALPTDPSFQRIEQATLDNCIIDAKRHAHNGNKEAFLLSVMRLMALPGNGHTRVIPNNAISVLPLRFVSIDTTVQLTSTTSKIAPSKAELVAVNGAPLSQIERAAEKFLAGTRQRKRVVGPILLAWPYALAKLGFPSKGDKTEYRLQVENGQTIDLKMENDHTVPASALYPRNEHGRADPAWKPETFLQTMDWKDLGFSVSLPSFFDAGETALPEAISRAAEQITACPNSTLLIDVRGNTGGDFLRTMPLIEAISEPANRQVVVLVDKFTFSAAIVFVAILKHRLGGRLKIFGEEMGDGLTFYAEGGLIELPTSGAAVRYSSAYHDWKSGTTDRTTPLEIAQKMVPAGTLELDQRWFFGLTDGDALGALHRRVLASLN